MSSILKALKKLEEEKTARRNGSTDIARGILRNIPGQNMKTRWMLPVLVAGSALAAALLTYFLTGGHSLPGREAVPSTSRRATSEIDEKKAPVQAPAPAVTATAPSAPDKPVVATTANSAKKKQTIRAVTAPLPGKRPVRLPDNKAAARMSPEEQLPEPNNGMLQKNAAESARPPDVHSPPALRVSGIAWNIDSSERLAVVNGMPVTEGTTIEGARVEEIMKDKVRFSFEKKTFDVAVGNEMR
jgi:general secretion pathway protein B